MRFAHRLADRQPDFRRRMDFVRALGVAPGGHPVLLVDMTNNGVRYQFKPWSRVDPFAIRGQLLRDAALFGSPSRVRWVFDGKRLGMRKADLVREVRRILTDRQSPLRRHPGYRQWLDALDRLIMVVS